MLCLLCILVITPRKKNQYLIKNHVYDVLIYLYLLITLHNLRLQISTTIKDRSLKYGLNQNSSKICATYRYMYEDHLKKKNVKTIKFE